MSLRRAHALLVLPFLAACAAGPRPHLAMPLKEVATGDLAQYWQVDASSVPQAMPAADGCFRVRAIVDSDGKVFEPRVLAVVGDEIKTWLPDFLAQLRFKPMPQNPDRIPIRTTLTWTLSHSVETTTTVPAASLAAAVKSEIQQGPSDETKAKVAAFNRSCQQQMDRQMGISPP